MIVSSLVATCIGPRVTRGPGFASCVACFSGHIEVVVSNWFIKVCKTVYGTKDPLE